MLAQAWDRTVWIDLRTGKPLRPTSRPYRSSALPSKGAVYGHYPGSRDLFRKLKFARSFEKETAIWFEFAKTALKTDGHHLPIAILGHIGKRGTVHVLDMLDQAEKHVIYRALATEIERTGATFVMMINETWVSTLADARTFGSPSSDPHRREALVLEAADASGKNFTYMVLFHRNKDGKIRLGAQQKDMEYHPLSLRPILDVWSKKRDRSE